MIKKCENCGMKADLEKFVRCPRCNKIVEVPKKCEDCSGCSLFNKDKDKCS